MQVIFIMSSMKLQQTYRKWMDGRYYWKRCCGINTAVWKTAYRMCWIWHMEAVWLITWFYNKMGNANVSHAV